MKSLSLTYSFGAVALCALAALLSGCGREQSTSAHGGVVEPSLVKVEESPDVNVITPEHPEQFRLVGVELQPIRDALKVTGSVAPDISRSIPVVSLSGGRVLDVKARLGDEVKKGQPLLNITSPDISSAFSEYQKFQTDEVLARKQLDRAQLLYEKGALAQKDLQVAEDTEQKAKVPVADHRDHRAGIGHHRGTKHHPRNRREIARQYAQSLRDRRPLPHLDSLRCL